MVAWHLIIGSPFPILVRSIIVLYSWNMLSGVAIIWFCDRIILGSPLVNWGLNFCVAMRFHYAKYEFVETWKMLSATSTMYFFHAPFFGIDFLKHVSCKIEVSNNVLSHSTHSMMFLPLHAGTIVPLEYLFPDFFSQRSRSCNLRFKSTNIWTKFISSQCNSIFRCYVITC